MLAGHCSCLREDCSCQGSCSRKDLRKAARGLGLAGVRTRDLGSEDRGVLGRRKDAEGSLVLGARIGPCLIAPTVMRRYLLLHHGTPRGP